MISFSQASERYVKAGDVVVFDGEKVAHRPGDIFKIKAGKRVQLSIQNFTGSAEHPIFFINSGGVVDINNAERSNGALNIIGCKHVRISGSGDSKNRYGIRISCSKKGPHALNVVGKSSSIEIDHIEVYGAGFAGFNVKDEPSLKNKTTREYFTMRNISLHDNYVHDVKGEGFYIGHTFYDGYDPKKTGKPLMPHVIKGLRIYNNEFENTGCEGLQVGSAVEDCEIYNNTIRKSGIDPFAKYQNNGMQIGHGVQAKVYNNFVGKCPGNSLVVFGKGEVIIENNMFLEAGNNGVYVNTKGGDSYRIHRNSFINPKQKGLLIGNWSQPTAKMEITQNLIVVQSKKGIFIDNQNAKAHIVDKGNTKQRDYKPNDFKSLGASFEGSSQKGIAQRAPLTEALPAPWRNVE